MSMITKAARIYKREGVITLIRRSLGWISFQIREKVLVQVLYVLWDKFGIVGFDRLYTEEYFENMLSEDALGDAEIFFEVLDEEFDPDSVIELGCGPGRMLYPFHKDGVDIKGVDNSESARAKAIIPSSKIELHDLREPYVLETTYDLVLCVEVLEHIDEKYADIVVESIANSGDVAIVTAAEPGQGGRLHLNEQPNEYWIEKFARRGMIFAPQETERIKGELELSNLDWLHENLLVFEQGNQR